MGAILNHHIPAALLADHICHFVLYFIFRQLLLRLFDRSVKIRVEIPHDGFPLDGAVFHTVQQRFQIGRKVYVHNAGKGLLHHIVNHFAQFGNVKVFILLGHVAPRQQRGNGGRIGAGPSDPQLLHHLHQRRFRVMGRRLGEMLLAVKSAKGQAGILLNSPNQRIIFCLFFVPWAVHG